MSDSGTAGELTFLAQSKQNGGVFFFQLFIWEGKPLSHAILQAPVNMLRQPQMYSYGRLWCNPEWNWMSLSRAAVCWKLFHIFYPHSNITYQPCLLMSDVTIIFINGKQVACKWFWWIMIVESALLSHHRPEFDSRLPNCCRPDVLCKKKKRCHKWQYRKFEVVTVKVNR